MMIDKYGRKINYLRVSVTERCNFRCKYCMPTNPFEWQPKENLLSFEELFLFVKVAIDEGIDKIRITGGEPLIRQDVDKFIAMINDYKKGLDLAMTTNGYFLKDKAALLKSAGLKRLNISLDTLNPKKAKFISQKDILGNVLKGIEAGVENGFKIKLNTVALKGINDDELIDLINFAKSKNAQIRFIEYMENTHGSNEIKGLDKNDILNIISKKHFIKELQKEPNSPSSLFELEDGYKFGIIAPHKHDFCQSCNRIRLSAEGLLIPCLYFDDALSIKKAVKDGDIAAASEILRNVINNKPEKNRWGEDTNEISNRAFYETGG
ncbi:GTP 3',8-cyclase MoaA [Campylobacter sputorum]|uniref:GTP 3',8-cyclase MoaA n=1 Tax=Campylobacter sputorum TaxID=206 RepID=UPI00053BFA46|nr:GTP 3',8-cyclase MoaA [Campylobacter sputorum]